MTPRTIRFLAGILVCVMMICGGGGVGLGTLIYASFFSGEPSGDYPLTSGQPLELELSPDMSPVALNAYVTYIVPRGQFSRRHAVYDGRLTRGAELVWEGQFGPSIDDDDHSNSLPGEPLQVRYGYVLPALHVRETAVYTFTAQPSFEVDLEVIGVGLSLRRNVLEPNIPVVVAGLVTLVAGILGTVFLGVRALRTSRELR